MKEVKVYLKRDTIARAVQWDGNNFDAIKEFCQGAKWINIEKVDDNILRFCCYDRTDYVDIGDYIVNINDSFINYSKDVFEQIYVEIPIKLDKIGKK